MSDEIIEHEVRRSIWKLNSGKTSGVCGIEGELLKAGGEVTVKWLQEIYSMVWWTGVVPRDWRRAVIVPIHKKGNRKLCKSYREISLLSVPAKAFASILNNRVRTVTEGNGRANRVQKRQRVCRTEFCDETVGRDD